MVFLIMMVATFGLMFPFFAKGMKFGLTRAVSTLGQLSSPPIRFLTLAIFFAVISLVSYVLIFLLVPQVPDFRKPADGGVGMALNVACRLAVFMASIVVPCIALAFALTKVLTRPLTDIVSQDNG